jgi:hypothetical protein
MALDPSNGYVAARDLQDLNENALPIFNVEPVQLQFSIASDFVASQVANNVLVLALANGRILRIDLDNPADIDGMMLKRCGLLSVTERSQISTCPREHPKLASYGACSSIPPPPI